MSSAFQTPMSTLVQWQSFCSGSLLCLPPHGWLTLPAILQAMLDVSKVTYAVRSWLEGPDGSRNGTTMLRHGELSRDGLHLDSSC